MRQHKVWAAGLLLVLGLSWFPTPAKAAASTIYGTCVNQKIPVAISSIAATDLKVSATYCTPDTWADGIPHTADVLVAGASYNHTYWDWPQDPATYSYVDKTLQAGRASLSFDRLGVGQSSRPDGSALNVTSDAEVVHQLITWVHNHGASQVNSIGHSLGSITVTHEAAVYQDVNRVVLTGILHIPGTGLNATGFETSLYPAALDPQFAGMYNLSYLTTLPGRRGPDFYSSSADPAVIAYDESHKDVFSAAELVSSSLELTALPLLNYTSRVTAPVLIVMGAEDNIFCNLAVNCHSASAIKANEMPYFAHAASLDALSIPNTAHNLALHPSAPQSFTDINNWLLEE